MRAGLMLFALSPDSTLTTNVARYLDMPLGKLSRKKLSNTETLIEIQESVRGKDVYIIFSCEKDFNNSLLDLLIVVEAMKNASVGLVTIVFPSFPYARYDTVTRHDRCPIARLLADMLQSVDCDRVLTMDLHSPQVQGYFDIPVDNLTAEPSFKKWIKELNLNNAVLVTPNPQGAKRVAQLSESLGMTFAIVHISGTEPGTSGDGAQGGQQTVVVGEIKDRDCIIYDDIADKCFSLVTCAKFLKDSGAKHVHCIATHALFTEQSLQLCLDSVIDRFVVTDTIDQTHNLATYPNLETVDVAMLFAEAIRRLHNNEPLMYLFDL